MRIIATMFLMFLVPVAALAGNSSVSIQVGERNHQKTFQKGRNAAVTAQYGKYNHSSIQQSGDNHIAVVVQDGSGFFKSVTQNVNDPAYGSVQVDSRLGEGNASASGGTGREGVTVDFEFR